jgi:formylglycine-generating enzyme required for sulfatase activity
MPAGRALLGRARSAGFGWDNEFEETTAEVAAFRIDTTPVRNREFLDFVRAGGYEDREFWTADAWAWKERQGLRHPIFWRRTNGGLVCRTLFREVPLEEAGDWPVTVSLCEAMAFARHRGARLPTEAEAQCAARGTPDGSWRAYPWGNAAPSAEHGSFDFRHWAPTPVGSHPAGKSAFGVHEMVGNGWEWTMTPFAPFPGFRPMADYPEYSADFFDGEHFVMKGASPATARELLRPTFRNWFRPRYPYVYATFRCVR